jgi:hypothetical protein
MCMMFYVLSSVSVLKNTAYSDQRLPRLATWHSKVAGLVVVVVVGVKVTEEKEYMVVYQRLCGLSS